VVEVLLVVVILFQLTRKSYKPPKKPLTEKVLFLQYLLFTFSQKLHYLYLLCCAKSKMFLMKYKNRK
jgi:hypothetical protein